MTKRNVTLKILTIAGLMSGVSTIAMAQSQPGLNIGENDSVYVDAQTFSVTPGKAKGDTAAQVKVLGARALDAGAIIFRAGNKLYIADALPLDTTGSAQYAIPSSNAYGPNYAYGADRNAIIPSSNAYGPNYAVVPNPADRFAVYANNPADRNAIIPSSNAYGPNYAVVPNPADRFAVYVDDPDYVHFRLEKAFKDNWIPTTK
jgi:hypothetical protein